MVLLLKELATYLVSVEARSMPTYNPTLPLLAQAWATERAKQVVIKEIDKGNLKAAQWWLERKAKQEFSTNPLTVINEEVENDFVAKYFDGNNERMLDWLEATIKALRQ